VCSNIQVGYEAAADKLLVWERFSPSSDISSRLRGSIWLSGDVVLKIVQKSSDSEFSVVLRATRDSEVPARDGKRVPMV